MSENQMNARWIEPATSFVGLWVHMRVVIASYLLWAAICTLPSQDDEIAVDLSKLGTRLYRRYRTNGSSQ